MSSCLQHVFIIHPLVSFTLTSDHPYLAHPDAICTMPYVYEMFPRDWRQSSFPHDLIPHTLDQCAALHTFPPVAPTFYDRLKEIELAQPQPPATPAPQHCPSSRIAALSDSGQQPSSSSTPGTRRTRHPTAHTHELFLQLGGRVRFQRSTTPIHTFVHNLLSPVFAAMERLSDSRAEVLLLRWHDALRMQEARLWAFASLDSVWPPTPYAQRGPSTTDVTLVSSLPDNEVGITGEILVPSIKQLVHAFFQSNWIDTLSHVVGAAPDVGSGTADIALRRPADWTSQSKPDWDNVEKFVIETKLLSPQDWASLFRALDDDLDEGFKLQYNTRRGYVIDVEGVEGVWCSVLAQITEEFHQNRAKFVLVTDYERYVLFELEDSTTIRVSEALYRDRHAVPDDDVLRADQRDTRTTPMELIFALVMAAKESPNPGIWHDMARVDQAVKHDMASKKGLGQHLGKRRRNDASDASGDTSSAGTPMTLAVTLQSGLYAAGDRPSYSLPLAGLVGGRLKIPASRPDLVATIVPLVSAGALATADACPETSFESDDQPSLCWSSDSDIAALPSVGLTFDEFIGGGRTWDAYAGTLAVALPGGDSARAPVVFKHAETSGLETSAHAWAGYHEWRALLGAIYTEAHVLLRLGVSAPGVAPDLYAMWDDVGEPGRAGAGNTAVPRCHIVMALEDCGHAVARTEAEMRALDAHTKSDIITAYARVHAAGVLHGDVESRHVLRDAKGTIRIIDWEGALIGADADAMQNEMHEVLVMLGLEEEEEEEEEAEAEVGKGYGVEGGEEMGKGDVEVV
ncbi:unnamed protein product [Cutaneotrichosporon oleaginosum]